MESHFNTIAPFPDPHTTSRDILRFISSTTFNSLKQYFCFSHDTQPLRLLTQLYIYFKSPNIDTLAQSIYHSDIDWSKDNPFDISSLQKYDISSVDVSLFCSNWAFSLCTNYFNSLYLDLKHHFDQATLWCLIVHTLPLANEIFLSLRNDEHSFAELTLNSCFRGIPIKAVKIGPSSLSSLPFNLSNVVPNLIPAKINSPRPFGDKYAILSLIEYTDCKLTENTKSLIANHELDRWLLAVTQAISAKLEA